MKKFLLVLIVFSPVFTYGQILLTGSVKDQHGEGLPGANVFIENTFDGSSTDVNGSYSFETTEVGSQTLKIIYIGYEEQSHSIELNSEQVVLDVELVEAFNHLEAVTITAGSFEAGDVKRSAALNSMDVATTAGAMADISAAVQTLPGTTSVGESGRLFVRGGDAEETNIYIDQMLVPTPYFSSTPNMSSRGRFNPFLFSGTVFSTGGYSAEYGQALSSILLLNTSSLKEQDELNLSVMSMGGDVTATKRWENQALTVTANYFNMAPYLAIADHNQDFTRAPIMTSNELSYKQRTGDIGLLKVYSNLNYSRTTLNRRDLDSDRIVNYDLANTNYFTNISWKGTIGDKWGVFTGADFQINDDQIGIGSNDFIEKTMAGHFKTVFDYEHNQKISLRFGTEYLAEEFIQNYKAGAMDYTSKFDDQLLSGFIEANIYTSEKFVIRPGVRVEYSDLLGDANLAPRFSAAYKVSEKGQFSMAVGQFYQKPFRRDLLIDNSLGYQRADHYTFNYQVVKNDRIFRSEIYYKQYNRLTKYENETNYNNTGEGYAYGLDVFYRDNKTVKDGHFWVSYSYLQTERDYQGFPEMAIPSFASDHSLSVVYKHWFPMQRIMAGVDFNIASPRKYHNPNLEGFNTAEMPVNHNLNMNIAYVYRDQLIFYAAMTNVMGRKNQYGYEYASEPNDNGVYESEPIRGFSDRFYVLGVFLTMSKDKTKNQLDKIN